VIIDLFTVCLQFVFDYVYGMCDRGRMAGYYMLFDRSLLWIVLGCDCLTFDGNECLDSHYVYMTVGKECSVLRKC
jgi:hypothetical protein